MTRESSVRSWSEPAAVRVGCRTATANCGPVVSRSHKTPSPSDPSPRLPHPPKCAPPCPSAWSRPPLRSPRRRRRRWRPRRPAPPPPPRGTAASACCTCPAACWCARLAAGLLAGERPSQARVFAGRRLSAAAAPHPLPAPRQDRDEISPVLDGTLPGDYGCGPGPVGLAVEAAGSDERIRAARRALNPARSARRAARRTRSRPLAGAARARRRRTHPHPRPRLCRLTRAALPREGTTRLASPPTRRRWRSSAPPS